MRERKTVTTQGAFTINPKRLDTLTQKPQHINPMKLQQEVSADQSEKIEKAEARELRLKMEESLRTPQEKSKWPMTSNQTLGWMWKEGVENFKHNKRWNQSLSSCEETRYAKAYVMMSGKSPYASK